VFKAGSDFIDSVDVHAAFVGEGSSANKGGPGIVMEVGQFVDKSGKLGKLLEISLRQDFFSEFEFKEGEEGSEVAIPRALPVPIHRPLDLQCTLLNSGDGIGNSKSAIVVGVDPDLGFGEAGSNGAYNGGDFRRKASSVGVAKDEVIGSSLGGGFQSTEGVIVVGGETVKEVFSIVDGFTAFFFEEGDGIRDHTEIFYGCGAEDFFNVKEPAFSEDSDDGSFGFEEEFDLGIGRRVDVRSAGGPEGGQFTRAPLEFSCFCKKIAILVVGARPTAFHIVETVGGEAFGKAKFIG
jgi:hypothetical protein